MSRRIVPFASLTAAQQDDAARILREALAHMDGAYNGPGEAEAEVQTFRNDDDRFGFAILEGDRILGWIGCVKSYDAAWELHPLVIDPARQRQGLGARLTAALEAEVARQGVLTLYLGTDDDFGGTSLFGADVFPDVLARLGALSDVAGHPFAFYKRLGYEVVGVIPDANGFGKPDILMAKRVGTIAADQN
jgi:aminoglycoside 6'-N-acetyltransferase I